jgi:putative transposase
MARTPRQFVPGYPSHVVHRGNNRQKIFHSETDYRFLWRCMKEATEEFQVAVNAYVFMTNHVHFLLTPGDSFAISNAMHSVSRRYAGYFNRRYERTGTLWEGRFHASLVTTDRYLFGCHRYIDLNPVRAGLALDPSVYPWSSHRFYTMDEPNALVTPHPAIAALGDGRSSLRTAYRALFASPLDGAELEAIRKASLSGTPIGAKTVPRGRRVRKCVPDTNFYSVPDTNS